MSKIDDFINKSYEFQGTTQNELKSLNGKIDVVTKAFDLHTEEHKKDLRGIIGMLLALGAWAYEVLK